MPASASTQDVEFDTSHLTDDSGDTGRPMPGESGATPVGAATATAIAAQHDPSLPRKPTEADFKDVLTPGADFADVEGGEFSGDVRPSNDSLGGSR